MADITPERSRRGEGGSQRSRHKAQAEFDLVRSQTSPERRRLLLTVLDAVYVDVRDAKAVVSIRPKAAFEVVLEVMAV